MGITVKDLLKAKKTNIDDYKESLSMEAMPGKTPMETFLENVTLAKRENLGYEGR